jgi:hypothetical protein
MRQKGHSLLVLSSLETNNIVMVFHTIIMATEDATKKLKYNTGSFFSTWHNGISC